MRARSPTSSSPSPPRNRLLTGGWSREVTDRELPIATELAGVNMRLKPGGIREMHWHKEAEWAYMLAGRCRITLIDQDGRTFIDDVGVGDLWNFPSGLPHSIQGLEEGCESLLVFDDGHFSENETFLLTDWCKHTPRSVLAKNFGVPEAAFANLPTDPIPALHVRGKGAPAAGPGCGPLASRHGAAVDQPPHAGPEADQGRGGRCASPTPPTSPSRTPSRRWWRSSPAGCASCTGIRPPTSGSTTSPGRGA